MKKTLLALLGLLVLLVGLTGCGDSPKNPTADSDSNFNYANDPKIPVDTAVYTITGKVVSKVNSVTRQEAPASGSLSGSQYYVSGSFTGPITDGKGYVRLLVSDSSPGTDLAPPGEVTIVKTTDTKATALLEGDVVTFKCRRQYENIAATQENQQFEQEADGTYELDYCRLATSVIQVDDN